VQYSNGKQNVCISFYMFIEVVVDLWDTGALMVASVVMNTSYAYEFLLCLVNVKTRFPDIQRKLWLELGYIISCRGGLQHVRWGSLVRSHDLEVSKFHFWYWLM
jgi:hypothetical protein